jgi:molybdate transport system substrate-binding protein
MEKLLLGVLLLGLAASVAVAGESVTVAAAADLQYALSEIADDFTRETGQKIGLVFGSSGKLAIQIRNGGPFQIFFSADEEYVLQLHTDGFAPDEGVLYAIGRIVLFASPRSQVEVDGDLKGLAIALGDGRIKRLAIANPDHAPYGKRAEEVLRHHGLWENVKPKLVYGENVGQTAQFVIAGAAEAGIIALSLAKSPPMEKLGRYAVIPADWHTPLKQRMVLLKGAGNAAKAFYAYLRREPARKVFSRYGFTLPEGHEGKP